MKNGLSSSEVHTAPETSLPPIGFSRRRLLWLGVLALTTIAVLLSLGDVPTTLGVIRQADWRLIALAVIVHYSGFAVRGHRWQLLLRASGYRLGYLYTTGVLLGGWFVSALLPVRLGEVFRITILKLSPGPSQPVVPVANSLSSIILERALDMSALLFLSATFAYLALGAALPGWITTVYIVALVVLVCVVAALLVAPSILLWLKRLSANRLWSAAIGFAQRTVSSLRTLPAHPRIALATGIESLYIWMCDAILLWLVLQALRVQFSFASAGFVALAVDISAAVPLTPGGMGQIEAAYSALLALLSVAPASISATVLLARIITYWSFLIFSGIVTFAAGFGSIFALRSEIGAQSPAPGADAKP